MVPAGGSDSMILSTRGISKTFGELRAVDDVSIEIGDGEFFTIVGPSGSGKSTFVRILAGLEPADSGSVTLRGEDITGRPANARPTCLVFQSLALFTHRTVGENIEFSQKMKGVAKAQRREHAYRMMDVVRLPREFYDRPVTRCSGGEQQRVALARALASDPDILFFDEPLSAIDYRLRKILEVEMKDLHRRTGKTFIYITHSLEEAMVMSDRIAIMRNGSLVQTGTPQEIYRKPTSRFVAEFMGEVNILAVADGRFRGLDVAAPNIVAPYLMVRPEYLRPAREESMDFRFQAAVTNDYMLGSRTQFHLDANGTSLVAELPALAAAGIVAGDVREWGFDCADAVPLEE